MRLRVIATVFFKELRETLRDRRSMIVMFGVPLLLYPLLTIILGNLAGTRQRERVQKIVRVAVVNADGAPELVRRLAATTQKFQYVQIEAPDKALRDGDLDAVVKLPEHAQRRALDSGDIEVTIALDRSQSDAGVVEQRVERLLQEYQDWLIRQRLAPHGVDPEKILKPIAQSVEDVATGSQRMGRLLAMMLPNILLLTGMLGAFFPALNATTTERETGTLETLLVTPAGRGELLVAKGSLVLLSSMLTAALNLVSMSLVLWRYLSAISASKTTALQGTLTLSPGALALSFVAVIPALVFFSAMVLVVGLFARSFREANSYATIVMLLPLVSVFVSIAEPSATPATLITPVVNTTIVIRDALTGKLSAGAFAMAFVSSSVYAALMLRAAAKLFSSEQLVNPSWEPLSLRGLRRAAHRPRGLPGIEGVALLLALSVLLLFYVSPSVQPHGLMPVVLVNQLLLIAAPTLLVAWLARWRWREAFSWRLPSLAHAGGAAMVGLGAVPWAMALAVLQSQFWPPPETTRQNSQFLMSGIMANPWLAVSTVALLAGVCEELLYRGPVQSALMRRARPGVALFVGGLLFALVHMSLHGAPVRTLLGIMLGWLVWRSGSILAGMLAHALYDGAALGLAAWTAGRLGAERIVESSATPRLTELTTPQSIAQLAIGTALLIGGWWLMRLRARAT